MNSTMTATQPPFPLDEKGPRTSREAREASRAARNGANSHYRRARSPPDDWNEEPVSPVSDVKLEDARAILANAQNQQRIVPITTSQLARQAGNHRKPPPRSGSDPRNGDPRNGDPRNGDPRNGQTPSSPNKSQPPTYSGAVFEDGPQSQANAGRYGHYRRNTGPSGGGTGRRQSGSDPSLPPSGPHHQSSGSASGSPTRQTQNTQNRRPQSLITDSQPRRSPSPLSEIGASINRLNSPAIGKTVLLPLEQKIHEYDRLMEDAQNQMMQLDEELRAMQERRRQAEDRFIEAKSKHDEYERQHADVGRALRGELERQRTPRPMPRMESLESFRERPVSEQSSKTSQKMRARDRLRMSIFKG